MRAGVMHLRVVAVVPARDEEATVGEVVRGLLAHGASRVVVADNGSRDATARVAREAGAEVVREEARGYGAACLAALTRLGDAEVVLFCDADGSSDPAEAPILLGAIEAGADLVIGARRRVLPGAMTPPQRFGTALAAALVRLGWGAPITDLGPFRAIRRAALDRLGLCDRTWGWTVEMQIRAIEEGLRVVEVPVSFLPRAGGRSKISGTVRGVVEAGAKILWTIGRHRVARWGRTEGRGSTKRALAAVAATVLLLLPLLVVDRVRATGPSAPPAVVRGMAYSLHPARGFDPARAVGEIADLGANAVEIVVPYYQRDARDTAPGAWPGRTPRPDEIRGTIRAAQGRGMRVWILPIVLLDETRGDEWRGVIAPGDTPAWWRSYRGILLELARIAEEEGAEALAVGSELLSRETERGEWLETIRGVRAVFSGRLLYSANWDHYEVVSFWDALDVVGISSYFEVGRSDPTDAGLRRAWRSERERLLSFARRVKRPLLLTEVGCPAIAGGSAFPWNYTRDAPIDEAEQARALRAFSEVWRGTDPAYLGEFLYEWDEPARRSAYSPRGRAAEAVVRAHLAGGAS